MFASSVPPIVYHTIFKQFCDHARVSSGAEVGVGRFLCGTSLKTVACWWVSVLGACCDAASAYEGLGTVVPLFCKMDFVVQGCVFIACWMPVIDLVMRSSLVWYLASKCFCSS